MITPNASLRELYATPLGHDILARLLLSLGKSEKMLQGPLGWLKLKHLRPFVGKALIDALIDMLNLAEDEITDSPKITPKWWKEAVFYQIYPRSFCDSNGDGIGDLQGIISKLDYIQSLGVDCLWLSPIFDSPNDDMGYDIRDYRKIMAEMGTMEDFQALLHEVHARGMRLILDLVVNHSSDEHEWYQKALNGDKHYQDYYFFRDKPNNWKSFFGGSAWKYEKKLDKYALHLFSQKQMDLNWDNPALREEVLDLVKFYHEMGVDGFRMDVINFISKKEGLPDGNEMLGKLMTFRGIEHYFFGPHLYTYLKELKAKAFTPYNAFCVGETPGLGIEMIRQLTHESREALDLCFQFDHLENPGKARFDLYRYDLNFLKQSIYAYDKQLGKGDWRSLFLENHDNPRIVSKILQNPAHRVPLAKMLLGLLLTSKGTPFLFQGQELAACNLPFQSIEDMRDIESLNKYKELQEAGLNAEQVWAKVLAGSRDHARCLLNWDDSLMENAWIPMLTLGDGYSVASQEKDTDSCLHFLRKLTAFRKAHPVLVYGDVLALDEGDKQRMCFARQNEQESLIIEINLTEQNIPRKVLDRPIRFNNAQMADNHLLPYAFVIYENKSSCLIEKAL